MIRGLAQMLDSHNALEHLGCFVVLCGRRHDTGTVDEVDAPHKGDVLPNLGFTWNGCYIANLFFLEGIDDTRLANIGIADETNGNLLAIGEEGGELAQ